ncbi:hypothetical protein IC235_15095 [Hymenobacter sp. BT664]|uniref:DUF3078 domain-containing protein n=1 Tax=Hymenobacter montanus TaxID=2771359 RepID=A0A927BF18_9BACT|nr:hypothetical protein [Hymenobacter montanus]MBD2769216.1 hypothetical protein [Hymenobacter montanus]
MKIQLPLFAVCLLYPLSVWSQTLPLGNSSGPELVEKGARRALSATKSEALTRRATALRDSLLSVKGSYPSLPVYSEKLWRSRADSLAGLPLGNALRHAGEAIPQQEVSKEKLLGGIQREFFSPPANVPPAPAAAVPLPVAGVPAAGAPETDLAGWTLPDSSLQKLSPMAAGLLKTDQLSRFANLRKVNLKQARLKLTQTQQLAKGELLTYTQKPTFWERSYFEGLVGMSGVNLNIVQFSPALGYHFLGNLSLGVGPNLLLRRQGRTVHPSLGVRAFLKAEFLARKAYLQAEDLLDSYGEADPELREIFKRHNLMICAGYRLALSSSLSLNLSVGYQLQNTRILENSYSPWMLRTGISTNSRDDR